MGEQHELTDARESLRYWEARERTLPRRARRQRREAREHVARWRERVAEAERDAYGRGIAGALAQIVMERRLPATVRHVGLETTRHGRRAVKVAIVATALGLLLMLATGVLVLLAALGAL